MEDHEAMRRRNEGKLAVQRRVVWSLEVGSIRLRCLKNAPVEVPPSFIVQCHDGKRWQEVVRGTDSKALLRRAVDISTGEKP